MTIEMHGGHFGSHPADRFISTRRIGERVKKYQLLSSLTLMPGSKSTFCK